ncbi:MAG: spermidine/putrescine ABC transporter substrate-binding protein [Clostridiales bacterium]|jgi:spermidine/putrescine transport system substrate-binding protein|nr:spermidine/putrescine ABC transporter substrate-binding protein [Clostridiales bacterium]
MKKTLALIIALAMMLSLGITASAAERKEINIFMWSDYISDDLIANFEDEYGVRVNLSYMNDNADSITKLTAGAGDGYDLIMTCDAYMESLIAGGYLEKLDLSKIPNSKNINKAYWSEQNQDYCVPYLMNYIYVVYDTERCPIEITCYNDLIRPEMKGQIGSVDGARNLFPIALIALGYDPNSRDEKEIAEAYEWLVKYNENVLAYGSTETNIVNGTISCMFTYDGNTAEAMAQLGEDNKLIVAPFTKDPVQLGFDLFVIPKGAQHMDDAYAFLNYICDPEVMAANLVDNPYSCPNDAAVAAASEEYRNGPAFDFDYKTNIFFQEDVGDAITVYDKYYQMLKAG